MIHLQKHIRDLLDDELNNNSLNLVFDVFLYDGKINSQLMKEINVENTYLTEKKRYIPLIIQDIFGEYSNMPKTTVVGGTITSSLLVPVDKKNMNNIMLEETFEYVSEALDEFRQRNIGRSLPLGDVSYLVPEEYQFTFALDSAAIIDEIGIKIKFYEKEVGDIIKGQTDDSLSLRRTLTEIQLGRYIGSSFTSVVSFEYDIDTMYNIRCYVEDLGEGDYNYVMEVNGETYEEETQTPVDTSGEGIAYRVSNILGVIDFININGIIVDDITVSGEEVVAGENTYNWYAINTDNIMEIGEHGYISLEFTIPNPSSGQFEYGGVNHQEFILEMNMLITNQVFSGNQMEYYIDDVQVFPLNRDSGFGTESDTEQKVNEFSAKGVITETILSKEFTFYYKPIKKIIELIKKITDQDLVQNKTFTLKEKYPLFSREYEVVINMGGVSPTLMSPFTFSVGFIMADDILE